VNLLKSPLRRTTAAIAGAFIGLVGAVAFAGPASAHHPGIEASTECPAGDNWKITWEVQAFAPGDREANIDKVEQTTPDGQSLELKGENQLKTIVANGKIAANAKIGETQTLPKSVKSVKLKVWLSWNNGSIKGDSEKTVDIKPDCKPDEPNQPENPGTPEEPETPATPAEPTPIVEMNCTTIVIGLDNPKDGVKITLTFETSRGEKRTLVVNPGEKKTEKFSAKKGFTVTVGAKEIEETTTIAWEQPSEDCVAAGEGGGELPLTGANATTAAGVAGVVLLIGAGLFFMARRRKIKFTA
jgi:LPXTG-motif cell wall-anchored protein